MSVVIDDISDKKTIYFIRVLKNLIGANIRKYIHF